MRYLPALLALIACVCPAAASAGMVDRVDPFVGTGGHGHTFPGPTLPFGMVQLGPDTRLAGWDGCSGYHHSDGVIYGFSHTHLSGTGVGDYGDILFMPVTGEPKLQNGYPDRVDEGYGSRFEKNDETASAGYYAVRLADSGIDVELTATKRTGVHRYVFPRGRAAHVIVDLEHRDRLLDCGLNIVDDNTVAGYRRSTAWARDQIVYFRARFSRAFETTEIVSGTGETAGLDSKAVLSFGDNGGELLVQVAISAVDAEGAEGNLDAEWAGFDFDAARARARDAWSAVLDRFQVEGAGDEEITVFATALYHSFIAPNLFSDADGRYRGMDFEIHRAEDRNHYTVFSLWDTYRATHPLFTLVERERTRDFVRTFLAQYEQGGRLPVWELAANETDCMIGYHSVSVIADAYLKGIGGFDAEAALEAMVHSATLDHFGLDAYRRDGFIGADRESESVSKTLEYAYDDWTIARMADALDDDETAGEFYRRSSSWRHLFDPETQFFRPRRNGRWLTPYDPRRVDFNYTEANGWQYRFAVPHHVPEFVKSFGDSTYTAWLDSLFMTASATTGREQPDITGRIGQYAHGNEPSHHVAWLYHFTGRPDRSAERIDEILDRFYTAAPDGLIGNEDCGQMSSWYVLSAMGLYDVAPASKQWLVIPPRHERMSVRFEDGKTFTTRRVGPRGGAVDSVTFRGKPLKRSFLWHREVIGGGELVFYTGGGGAGWGRATGLRPGLPAKPAPVIPAPWAVAGADRFRGSMDVALAGAGDRPVIRWTDRGDIDPVDGTVYTEPIRIDTTTTLRFVALFSGWSSPVVTARFDAIENDWSVDVVSVPNGQYTAGGPDALIDGRRGPRDWRTGAWQGYQDQDFVATLDLGEPVAVKKAGAGFLQDMRSWIWMPAELVVEVSEDGKTFVEAGRAGHDVPDDVEGVFTRDLEVALDGRPVRAVRFRAVNYGTIPAWHPGAGGEAFIFVDELLITR